MTSEIQIADITPHEYPLFDAYFDYIGIAETPLTYVRWSLMASLGAYLGRSVHFPFGDFRIFPNMYVMLIGDPGARKSTAIKQMRKILSACDYTTFAGDKTSKEKFLLDLEGEEDKTANQVMEVMFGADGLQEPREVFVSADEGNEFFGAGNLEFLSLLGSLWDWDDESRPFEQRFKNSKSIKIWQPTISILAGNTHANLMECFPPQAIGQGFMSRMLFIFAEASSIKIPFPQRPPDHLKQRMIDLMVNVRDTMSGEISMTKKAEEMLANLYRGFKPLEDVRFQHYSTRRFNHLIKICTVVAAARFSMEVDPCDVIMANSILKLAEHKMPQALGEFGKAKNSDTTNKIMALLMGSDHPVPETAIWQQVRHDLDKPDDMQRLLAGLLQADKIQYIQTATAGLRGYTPVRKALKESELYVRYDWLREVQASR